MLIIPDRDFFNIGDACRILQVPSYTLRYWETQFRHLRPRRLNGGHRRYTRHDLETAFQIKDLLLNKKMTAAGARKSLSQRQRGGRLPTLQKGGGIPPAAIKLLKQIRDDLSRITSDLE